MLQGKNAFVEKWGKWLMFAGCFLFFAYVGWCTPLSSDDMEFASLRYDTLGQYWCFVCRYGNGRFLGNALAVAMTHLPWLRVAGKALVLASCVMLLPSLLGLDSLTAWGLSFLLLAGVDESLFAETFSWTSGFCNYVIPIWLTMLLMKVLTSRTNVAGGVQNPC